MPGDDHLHGGAPPRRRQYVQGTPEPLGALTHAGEPEAAPASPLTKGEPSAVVAHRQAKPGFLLGLEAHGDLACFTMADGIAARLANDSREGFADPGSNVEARRNVDAQPGSGPGGHLLGGSPDRDSEVIFTGEAKRVDSLSGLRQRPFRG